MSSPANTLSSQNWPVSYRLIPKLVLSWLLGNPTQISMAQFVANFASPLPPLTYNARTFTIPSPIGPTNYFVTVFDPALAGDMVGQTNLQAYCLDRSQQNGQPGYVFVGQILVGGSAAKVYPGGWTPDAGYTPADPYPV